MSDLVENPEDRLSQNEAHIFQALYVLCFSRHRYQVSVYRTIGPLVITHFTTNSYVFHLSGTIVGSILLIPVSITIV